MRRKHLIFAVAFSLLLGSFIALVAVPQQQTLGDLVTAMNEARKRLYHPGDPNSNPPIPPGAYTVYSDAFDVLEQMISTLKVKLERLYGIKIDSTSGWDAVLKVKKSIDTSSDIDKDWQALETQREEVEDKWLDAYDAWQAYHNAVAAYNSHPHVSESERLDVDGLYKYVATSIYACHGLCDVPFETASLAQVSHQAYCSEKHGKSGTTGVTYWTCFGNTTCQRSSEHWQECRASNCSVMFPPPEHEDEWDSWDHKVKCTECGKKYYKCEHSTCPDSGKHSGSGRTPPPPPPDDTPNCPDCTNHCSSPCGCSNSGTCNGSIGSPPDPPAPNPPTAPDPVMVQCLNCSVYYDSNDPDEVNWHTLGACYSN